MINIYTHVVGVAGLAKVGVQLLSSVFIHSLLLLLYVELSYVINRSPDKVVIQSLPRLITYMKGLSSENFKNV